MPQLDTTWFLPQLFWLVITFTCLYMVLSKVLLPRLMGVLDARVSAKSADLSAADALRKEAEHCKLQYERAMADARERAKSLFTDAEVSIKKLTDTANRQLEQKLEERMRAADADIAVKQKELQTHFEQVGAALVVDITAKLTGNAPALIAAQKAFTTARTVH